MLDYWLQASSLAEIPSILPVRLKFNEARRASLILRSSPN